MKKAILTTLTSALITGVAIKAAPALAETPAPETQVSLVRTADLDLSTPAGRRQLDLRLAHAAREVCGEASNVDVKGKNEIRRCRNKTLVKARFQRDGLLAAADRGAFIAVFATR